MTDPIATCFISYNHGDKPLAEGLRNGLTALGYRVWIDSGELRIGDSLVDSISSAIDQVDFLVALVSATSVSSPWCQKEVSLAMTGEIASKGITVLPCRVGDVTMPATLADKLYLSIKTNDTPAAVGELHQAMQRHLTPNPPLPPRKRSGGTFSKPPANPDAEGPDMKALQSLYDEAAEVFDSSDRACIIAVARPDQPRLSSLGRLDRNQVQSVFRDALSLSESFIKGGRSLSSITSADYLNPRLGLRRHTSRSHEEEVANPKRRPASVSLLDDGSLSIAWLVGGYHGYGSFNVPSFMLERTALDLVSLVVATSRQLAISSPYTVAMGLTPAPVDDPIVLISPDSTFGAYEHPELSVVKRFQQVSRSVPAQPTDDDLLAAARDLALDCVSQAGIGWLRIISESTDR